MTRWFQHMMRTWQPRSLAALGLGLLALTLAVTPAPAAPEYALSGRAAELEKSVLAQTSSSQITALDVLMLDDMRDHAIKEIPIEAWLKPTSLEATPYRPAMKAIVDRLLAYQALAAKAGNWQPDAGVLAAKSYGAATAVWSEYVVKPTVKVMEVTDPASGRTSGDIDRYYLAHPEKYLRRLRAQVRYIFMDVDPTDYNDRVKTRAKLETLASDIKEGKIKFDEAARKYSQAPTAAEGGLLPPFYNGTFFNEFDRQTFLLDQPGNMSPVFGGPEGYYLLQLVQTWPSRNIPIGEVRDEIRKTLRHDHVRHYYSYELIQLARKELILNYASQWNYLNLEAPVVQLDGKKLMRADFFRYYGNPIGSSYETRITEILAGAAAWAEGQLVTKDLAAHGLAGHPWIQRARELAAWTLKAEHTYAMQIPAEAYTQANAMQTIKNDKMFIQGLRSAHLVEFQIQAKISKKVTEKAKNIAEPLAPSESQPAIQTEASGLIENIISQMTGNATLPTEPTPVDLAEWFKTAGTTQGQLSSAIENLQQMVNNTPWPGIDVKIKDKDWVDCVPGTPWYDQLKDVAVGAVTKPVRIANLVYLELPIAERTIDLRDWEAKPLLLRALAFQIEASKIFSGEVLHIRQGGSVHYMFE